MFLAVFLLASLGVLVSAQADEAACPAAAESYHVEYLNARLQENVQLENDLFVYQLHINTPENGYEPGNTYDLRLRVNARGEHTPMRGFVVVATPLDDGESNCGFGRFGEGFPGVRTRPGCPHVRMNDGFEEKMYVGFNWTAPSCGCVKIRATVITDVREFFIDADTATQGPLTATVCPFNHVLPFVDEDDDDSVLDVLDLEFFGMEDDEEEEEGDEDSLSALEILLLEAIGVDSELVDVFVENGDDVDDSDLLDDDDDEDDDDDGDDDSDEEDEDEDRDEGDRRGGGRRRGGGPGWRRGLQRRRNRGDGEDGDDSPGRRRPPMHHRPGRHHQHHPHHHPQGPRHRRPGPGGNMDGEEDNQRRFGRRFGPGHGGMRFGNQRRYHRRQMTITERVEHVCERIQGPARPPHQRGQRQLNDTAREIRQQMFERHHQQIRNCCSLVEMDDKVECFEDLREERFDRICAGQESLGFRRHRRRRPGRQEQDAEEEEDERQQPEWMQECCARTDEERYTCFNESVRERKEEHRDRRRLSIEQRIERLNDTDQRLQVVCRKLQLPAPPRRRLTNQTEEDEVARWQSIWDERREEMRECCEVENAEERDECMHDIRDRRFERVCRGAEPLRPVTPRRNRDTQAEALETCCDSEDDDRLQCIKGRIGRHFGGRWHRRVQILSKKLRHLDNVTSSGLRGFFRRRFSRRNETVNVEIVREQLAPENDLVVIHYGAAADQQARQDNVEDEGGEQSREEEEEEEREGHPRRRTIRNCCEAGERRGQEPHNDGVCIRAAKQFAKRSPHFKFACKKAFTKCCVGDAREPGPRGTRGGRRAGPRAARNRGRQ